MESDERRSPSAADSEATEGATDATDATDARRDAASADASETSSADEPRIEQSADSIPEAAPVSAPKEETSRGDGERRPPKATPPNPTEAEIDAPDRRTLLLFGVIFIVTSVSWGAAKLSCNYHPPQSRPPPELRTEQLARSPKDAAIEFVFRRRTRNYQGALELAGAALAGELEKEGATCDAQGAACINERSRLEKTIVTTATVTELDGDKAVAKVTNHVGSDKELYEVRLEKDGLIWKTVAYTKL